jgi:hypothetical protein
LRHAFRSTGDATGLAPGSNGTSRDDVIDGSLDELATG